MMKQLFATVILGCYTLTIAAQTDTLFIQDPENFLPDFSEWILNERKALEPDVAAFGEVFSNKMDEATQREVVQTCNRMRNRRIPVSPYFELFIQSTNTFFTDSLLEVSIYKGWNKVLDDMVAGMQTRRLVPLSKYLQATHDFFRFQALSYSELGTSWYTNTDYVKFDMVVDTPIMRFAGTDLEARRKNDIMLIRETRGVFYPVENKWRGKGGKVDWERFQLEDEIYVELADYEVDLSKSLYDAENVRLTYPLYFGAKKIEGSFSDKLNLSSTGVNSSYPRFDSYDQVLKIDNFGKNVEYIGGFQLRGASVIGSASKGQEATIYVLDETGNQVLFRGSGQRFTIKRGELVTGEGIDAALYLQGSDSLYHPSVGVRFDINSRELWLNRGDRGTDKYPFASSFHKVNINADHIRADFRNDSLVVGMQMVSFNRSQEVNFESLDRFDPKVYYQVQSIADFNPIALLKLSAERQGTRFLNAQLLAQDINPDFTVENIQTLLYDLVAEGFIAYNPKQNTVEVKDKVYLYADADRGKVDYDNLNVKSETDTASATLNLKNEAMKVYGVKNLEFSSRQRVAIIPEGRRVTLKKNRGIDFHGLMYAGFSTIEGRWFHFQYDPYQVVMDSIRYFDLYVPAGGAASTQQSGGDVVGIASRIENTNGILLIDAPRNKSGRADIRMFPSFQSRGSAYVYYDFAGKDSTYSRDSFYFELQPFSFNNLDGFSVEDIQFKGNMHSAGIFPEFEETVTLQEEDQSLGFLRDTPEEGYPIFGGKGQYQGQIGLNNSGMRGTGILDYLDARIVSDNFVFKPKELTVSAREFNLEEVRIAARETPQVRGDSVDIVWRPAVDSMYISSTESTPFDLFRLVDANLNGTLVYSPGGLAGIGKLSWDRADLTSDLFAIGPARAEADTLTVGIRNLQNSEGEYAVYTQGVKGYVDFEEKMAHFEANGDKLGTELPSNQFATTMDEFSWDMAEEQIVFLSDADALGTFTSTHPDHDSLSFEALTAAYDLDSNNLYLGGVPFIPTCDALVYPDSNKVTIASGGNIRTLQNARIVADTSNKYHVINRAVVDVVGAKSYRASGFYEYNIANREQEIEFASIIGSRVGKGRRSEKDTETRAEGTVAAEDSFFIDFKTKFQGTISLNARDKNLFFDGFALLDAERLPERTWFSVVSEGDKKDLAIKFDRPKRMDGQPLFTGLYLSRETSRIYPRIFQALGFRKDRDIFPVEGIFKYRLRDDTFHFGDSSKVVGVEGTMTGNYLVFHNKNGEVEAEGKFNLGSGLKYIRVDAAGTAETSYPEPGDSTAAVAQFGQYPVSARLMAGVQMIVPEKLLKILATDLQSAGFSAPPITYISDINFYKKAAYEIFPEEENPVKNAIDGLTMGSLEIPNKFNPYTFLFSNLNMKWDSDYQSFVSMGDKVGVATVGGESIQRQLECYVEFKMPTNLDDRVYIYIKSPSGLFYFFGFKQGILSITSNNTSFMDELFSLKSKDLIQKMDDGQTYEIQAVEPGTARVFLGRIKAAQEGLK